MNIDKGNTLMANGITGVKDSLDSVAANVKTAGQDTRTGLDKVADKTELGLGTLAMKTETAGLDNKASIGSLTAELKSTGVNLATQNKAGLDGVATSLDAAKGSLDDINAAIQTQKDKLEAGLNILAANTANAGASNKASLDLLTVEVKNAGENTKGSLCLLYTSPSPRDS